MANLEVALERIPILHLRRLVRVSVETVWIVSELPQALSNWWIRQALLFVPFGG